MNTARAGRRDQKGLIVWKKFHVKLSEAEIRREILSLENEGFQVIAVKNSKTLIVAVSSEGLAYSTSRLRKIGYEWERTLDTHNQLNSKARVKLQELVGETSVARGGGVEKPDGSTDRSGE